jgi:pimeloyl-ACP methyl ester carboxylesterase
MPTAKVNGIQLFYELSGTGEIPLILVHGSWASHHIWDLVVPRLAESFRVLAYDRRGHSESQRPTGQGSVREDVADLAALIEHLGLAPAWVARKLVWRVNHTPAGWRASRTLPGAYRARATVVLLARG